MSQAHPPNVTVAAATGLTNLVVAPIVEEPAGPTVPAYVESKINRIGQATRFLANGTPGPHQQKPPEVIYKALIKAGHVKIVRRRGKPPQIVWLDDKAKDAEMRRTGVDTTLPL